MIAHVAMKFCSVCRTDKPVGDFYPNAAAPDGRTYDCRACRNARSKARHAAMRDREVPPAPISETRSGPRMLVVIPAGNVANNKLAMRLGVERRATCERYDDCLADVPENATDARCPRDCASFADVARTIDDFAGFRSSEATYPNCDD